MTRAKGALCLVLSHMMMIQRRQTLTCRGDGAWEAAGDVDLKKPATWSTFMCLKSNITLSLHRWHCNERLKMLLSWFVLFCRLCPHVHYWDFPLPVFVFFCVSFVKLQCSGVCFSPQTFLCPPLVSCFGRFLRFLDLSLKLEFCSFARLPRRDCVLRLCCSTQKGKLAQLSFPMTNLQGKVRLIS